MLCFVTSVVYVLVVGVGDFGFSLSQRVGGLTAAVDVSAVDPTHYFVLCGDYCVDIDGVIFLFAFLIFLFCSAFVPCTLCVVLSPGVGPILGGIGGDAFFEAGKGQGHQRHNQPSGVYVPQRE